MSLTPKGDPAGNLLDRLRGSSQDTLRSGRPPLSAEKRRGSVPRGLLCGQKLSEQSATLSDKSFHSPARRHPEGCFFTGEEETWEINTQSTMRPRQEDGERKKESPEISSGAP